MSESNKQQAVNKLTEIVANFTAMISTRMPDDVVDKLKQLKDAETSSMGKIIYHTMFDNMQKAIDLNRPTCQDTGEIMFFVKVGSRFPLLGELQSILKQAVCHRRLIELKRPIPYDLNGKAIFHAGPIVRKNGDKWEMVSVGPTTSMRMESFEREFIEQTGVKLVVGKGGMGPLTEEGCQKFKALHVIFPAGCAVLAATQVEEIEEVHWTELGMPESLWVCRVKEFGPLIVSIDTHGNNLIAENKKLFAERRDPIVEEICEHVHYIK
ncbi:TPA: L(+)-tartrate dehydratase subunit beta [Escherichia coli]|nr:L(+)-tartrate dehydratase subunit beta [Escherichia coli]